MGLEIILTNIVGASRRAKMRGRSYLVAPLVSIVPGVLNGSAGEYYYPAEEVGREPAIWNHMPMVADHPVDEQGVFISARDPAILERYGIGFLFNSQFDDRLRHDGWFDMEDVGRVNGGILSRLERGEAIELSTGLFLDIARAEEGSAFNGKPYSAITSNYRPDHLAVLTRGVGACAIADGCGVNVNAKISHSELHQRLQGALRERHGVDEYGMANCYVVAVYDREVVYQRGDALYRSPYTKDSRSGAVSLGEGSEEVRQQVSYKPVKNVEAVMDRKAVIDYIVANCECWKGAEDRGVLEGFSDTRLDVLKKTIEREKDREEVMNAALKGFTDPGGNKMLWNAAERKWFMEAAKEEKQVERLTAEEREMLAFAGAEMAKQKATLINRLLANVSDDARREALAKKYRSKSLEDLREMAELLPPAEAASRLESDYADYSGAAAINVRKDEDGSGPLAFEPIDWSRESE